MEFGKYDVLVVFLGLVCFATAASNALQERFSWKVVDFEFPDEAARNDAIQSGEFIPENNLPLGLERWQNKLFVTLPQWKSGTAATLTYIDLNTTTDHSPKLKPYPNWEANQIRRNNGGVSKIANVFRVNVDVCDRLWLVDAGSVDLLGKFEVIHAPKIQAYDLHTDKLLLDYPLPKSVYKDESFFANIIVDVEKSDCNNAYVYLADIMTYALVVYHLPSNDAWRISHYYFHFDPLSTNYNIGGVNFQWHDGIFGLALSAPKKDGSKLLYFHPMASTKEFAVSTRVLQNKTASSDYHSYKVLGCRGRKSESSAESFDDKTGVLFYTLVQKDAVGCWNTQKNYTTDNNAIIASDPVTMSFPNDLKVDKTGTLWVLTDRLPNFMYSKLNSEEVNFRIFSASTEQAIKGTVCDNSSSRLAAVSLLMLVVAGFVHTFVI